ncbi:MAG: Ppx/GppA family phosphatase [Candidatus Cloacimonetes bacterium]|nr:Ppx/GppA family phosphatase [Candidatus Cloacimonadota bacterium]
MDRYAILDIGTNSIKFFMFSVSNQETETIMDRNNISRLGEGLQKTGKISESAMERNITALREFIELAEKEGVKEIIAVGTMCLRTAKNSDIFVKKAKDELGLEIKVIPGEEEARLSYLAVLSTIGKTEKNVVVFDTGGGSTEFIFGKGINLEDRISLNLGAIHPTEEFLHSDPVTDDEMKKMQDFIKVFFSEKIPAKKADYLVGIGGTVTSMGAVMHKMVEYDPAIIQGSKMSITEVNSQLRLYQRNTIEERRQIPGLQPKRADVILAGAAIIKTIMEIFEVDSFVISDRGLRHGLMFDRYLR